LRNGPLPAGQVCGEKTNMCEPLLTHRKINTVASEPGSCECPGTRAHPWCAWSQGATCVLPWRCPVYRWRELVAGAGMEQENLSPRDRRPVEMGGMGPLVAKGRPATGTNRERQSTDTGHRDGPARSSGEGLVMGLERRGRAGQVTQRSTLRGMS